MKYPQLAQLVIWSQFAKVRLTQLRQDLRLSKHHNKQKDNMAAEKGFERIMREDTQIWHFNIVCYFISE